MYNATWPSDGLLYCHEDASKVNLRYIHYIYLLMLFMVRYILRCK